MQIQIHITANSPGEARAIIAALGQGFDTGVTSGGMEDAPAVHHRGHEPDQPCTAACFIGEEQPQVMAPSVQQVPPTPQPAAETYSNTPAMATPQPPIQPVVPPQAAADAYAARQQEFQANMAAVQASNGYPGYQPPVAPAPQAPGPMPAQAPTYTLEQLRAAGGQLMQAGKMAQLQAMLPKYGVVALTDLAKEHYGAVAAEMRAMGAAI